MDPVPDAMLLLCKELQALRDDVYNAAVIRDGGAFASESVIEGSVLVTSAATPVAHTLYENKSKVPVVVFVRVQPNILTSPPGALTVDQTLLLIDTDKLKVISTSRAGTIHAGYADGVSIVLNPRSTLYAALLASADVYLCWRVVPLRGRSVLKFGER